MPESGDNLVLHLRRDICAERDAVRRAQGERLTRIDRVPEDLRETGITAKGCAAHASLATGKRRMAELEAGS